MTFRQPIAGDQGCGLLDLPLWCPGSYDGHLPTEASCRWVSAVYSRPCSLLHGLMSKRVLPGPLGRILSHLDPSYRSLTLLVDQTPSAAMQPCALWAQVGGIHTLVHCLSDFCGPYLLCPLNLQLALIGAGTAKVRRREKGLLEEDEETGLAAVTSLVRAC